LGVCTQAFWVNGQGQYESWGPPLPLGYSEDKLKKMLSLS